MRPVTGDTTARTGSAPGPEPCAGPGLLERTVAAVGPLDERAMREAGLHQALPTVAAALCPQVVGACVAGHRSPEPGHTATVEHLGLRPLADLELRLGEGTGALLAPSLVQAAVGVPHEAATFDPAGVSDTRPGETARSP